MLALGIRYLQGVAVGSHGEYGRVEWPPHPARVFMAMVAAHYQTGADATERTALLWLEALPEPPEIHAPDAEPCKTVTQFVPVNDKTGPSKSVLHSLPITRDRQPRTFARASLASDTVVLHWPNAEPTPDVRETLAALCGKVTRIGHSISLVQMWLADAVPAGLHRWIVNEKRGTHLLRVPKAGTLEELDRSFNGEAVNRYITLLLAIEDATTRETVTAAKKELVVAFPAGEPPQQRPRISTYASYSKADEISETPRAAGSVFSPHLTVFTLERKNGPYRQLDLACTPALIDRWREAIASHANDLRPEAQSLLTGHSRDGSSLQKPHVAFLPLGFVCHPHADGRVPGVALALPNEMPADVRADVLRAASGVCKEGLKIGRLGAWGLLPSTMSRPLESLQPATWTAHPDGATHWSTVTPVAYDHHPKAKGKAEYLAEVAAMIVAGCERIGLPRPREVIPTPVSAHLGAPPAHAFPRLRRKDGSERRHTHAILVFDEPVRGPLIIGAGRYRGYGLCRPMEVES
jgi:CRISPR-associated protein Csb2